MKSDFRRARSAIRFVQATTLALTLLGTSALFADTITDSTLGVSYTATSSFTAGTNNTYDVFLNVDPTAFSGGSGFLTAFSLAFKTGSDIPTSVSLVTAPGGTSSWASALPGGLNASGCNGNGAASGDVCFQYSGTAANAATVPGGPYSFELAVTMPGSDVLSSSSDIKAAFNTAADNSGKNLGLTSMGITIQPSGGGGGGGGSVVPEPSTVGFAGLGFALVGMAALRRRLAQSKR